MDFLETEERRALREAVRDIAKPYGGAYYSEHAAAHTPCDELWSDLARGGFIGVNIPEAHGGGGGGLTDLAIVCEETAAAGAPLLLLLVSSAISGEVLARYGSDDQQREWLPRLAAGEKMVFAITEPEAGSNTHQLTTTATRDESGEHADRGDWILRGTKYYISGVDEADALLVVARTGRDEATGRGRLSLFVVPTEAPGLTRTPLPVDAMLPERQFTLFFDDVRLPAEALVGEEGQGFAQVFHGLNPERITGAALCVGVGRRALTQAAEYANTRAVWDGRPIGSHQGVAHPLAQAKIETELAALMTAKAAWAHDEGVPAGEASNMAKYAAAEAGLNAVTAAIQTHGGNGMASEYGLVPLWGLVRLLRIAPVSREMVLNHVAQHSLGLPRSY